MLRRRALCLIIIRTIAVFWMVRGLMSWADLVNPPILSDAAGGTDWSIQIVTVLYAVADIVGAVGLWLAAPWGAVVWFISAGLHLQAEFVDANVGMVVFEVIIGALCWASFWLLRRVREETEHQSKFL